MRRLAAALALAMLAAAACAGDPSASGEPEVDRLTAVALQRTGGFAGTQDEVVVQPDGRWTRGGRPGSATGRLTADRNDTLTRMTADPALRAEATRTSPKAGCVDAFDYLLTVGDTRVAWQDCDAAPPAVAGRIARFLLDSTK
jgi:hypothetical protein